MIILNVLSSNKYSGAENVVCQIASLIGDKHQIYYCSPNGPIEESLKDKNITFVGMNKINILELNKVIKKVKPDIIHAHDIKASFLVSLTHKKIPYICHLHNNAQENRKFTVKSFLFKLACKNAKKVIFVSNSNFNDFYFKKQVEKKSVILKNVISANELESKVKQDLKHYKNDVIFLGRLSEPKNPLYLLEILKLAVEKNKVLNCSIIGDGELRQQCEEFIKINKLEKNIKLYGFLSNPYKILKDSKVMLMSSEYEGTPMCALESIALGVPIVSTATDGLVDLIKIGKTGYIYKSKEEAVKYIFKILKNPSKYKKDCLTYSKKINNLNRYKKEIEKVLEKK
ncbi:MAG: glycosyltransferase [Clostridia bacterium]|nr:glycosyltransferase [Clostridia bacterium]